MKENIYFAILMVMLCCLLSYVGSMDIEDLQNQAHANIERQKKIDAAMAEYKKQQAEARTNGMYDDANRMMYPCCQAHQPKENDGKKNAH